VACALYSMLMVQYLRFSKTVCVAKCATTPHGVVLRKKERKKNDYDMSAIVTPPPPATAACALRNYWAI